MIRKKYFLQFVFFVLAVTAFSCRGVDPSAETMSVGQRVPVVPSTTPPVSLDLDGNKKFDKYDNQLLQLCGTSGSDFELFEGVIKEYPERFKSPTSIRNAQQIFEQCGNLAKKLVIDIDGNGKVQGTDYELIGLYFKSSRDVSEMKKQIEAYPGRFLGEGAKRKTALDIKLQLDRLIGRTIQLPVPVPPRLDMDGNKKFDKYDNQLLQLCGTSGSDFEMFEETIKEYPERFQSPSSIRNARQIFEQCGNLVKTLVIDIDDNRKVEGNDYELIDLYFQYAQDPDKMKKLIESAPARFLGEGAKRKTVAAITSYLDWVLNTFN